MNKKKAIRELADAIYRLSTPHRWSNRHRELNSLERTIENLQGAMEALNIEALHIEDNAITTAHRAIEGGRNA